MKKTIRLTENDIRRMVMESMDAWEDAIYKKNQDQGFRHRYGIGQDWPHYDNEDYDNGIWQDDDGKCWTVYPGERQATCLDDEMNESVGRKTIRLTESELKNLIRESVKRVLNEEKYVFSCYIEGEGNYKTTVNDIRQLTPYIQKAKYWDISKGWNTSEPENLVAWGGEGGYWNNFLEKQDWAKEGVHWNKPSEKIAKLVLSKKKN